ncbi:MAG: efflux RND transporter periplasmic adaptor subunit [Desulfobacterales bacterium]|nr:efflux RND transporter periplasmic adaptor subunit [Desulfobacterales bacterium]
MRKLKIIIILLILSILISGCSNNDALGKPKVEDSRKKKVVPVNISISEKKDVPLQIKAVGNVRAYSTLSVIPQVNGELLSVHFKEGDNIKEGDLLFTINPAPFKTKLNQAEANLAKDMALLENARKQVNRYSSIAKKGFVAEEQYDKILTDMAVLEASVKSDKASIENAKIDLEYCSIKSKIDGVSGDIKINKGNIVKSNGNEPLVIINKIEPIDVVFSIPEKNVQEIRQYMSLGKLKVSASIPSGKINASSGELVFMDNAVDSNTGTIQLKATFPNKDRMMWPGQFVQVVVTLTNQANATVIPFQAVQTGQLGQYVFVVKPDMTVDYRSVTVERTIGDVAVISKGVSSGEKVVTDGHMKLTPGSNVKIIEGSAKKS